MPKRKRRQPATRGAKKRRTVQIGVKKALVTLMASCLSDRGVKLQRMLAFGADGSVYASCIKNKCTYVAKIVVKNNRTIPQGYKIAQIASKIGITAPVYDRYMCPIVTDAITKAKGYVHILISQRFAEDLKKYVQDGKQLTVDDAQRLLSCVERMHDAKIFHTDLKPDNIGVVSNLDSRFWIIDFDRAFYPKFSGSYVVLNPITAGDGNGIIDAYIKRELNYDYDYVNFYLECLRIDAFLNQREFLDEWKRYLIRKNLWDKTLRVAKLAKELSTYPLSDVLYDRAIGVLVPYVSTPLSASSY